MLTQAVPLLSDEYADPVRARQLFDELTARVAALPGVEAAAGVLLRPLAGPNGFDASFTIEGRPAEEQASYPLLNLEAVTPDYFRVMGLPLDEGRTFGRSDDADAPGVVVVSRALAEAHWPGESPVGKRLKWGGPESQAPWMTVVGVVGDARYRSLEEVSLNVYVPHTQTSWSLNHLVVRTASDPLAVAPAVRQAMRLTLAGVGLGLAVSLWLGRALAGVWSEVLYEVAATDAPTLATVPWVLVVSALVAAAVPALRASRVDPGVVLGEE